VVSEPVGRSRGHVRQIQTARTVLQTKSARTAWRRIATRAHTVLSATLASGELEPVLRIGPRWPRPERVALTVSAEPVSFMLTESPGPPVCARRYLLNKDATHPGPDCREHGETWCRASQIRIYELLAPYARKVQLKRSQSPRNNVALHDIDRLSGIAVVQERNHRTFNW